MNFDAEAKRLHANSLKPEIDPEKILYDTDWLQQALTTDQSDTSFLLNAVVKELQNDNTPESLQETLLSILARDWHT